MQKHKEGVLLKWDYLFDERRLAEGRRFYDDGMVQDFRKEEAK